MTAPSPIRRRSYDGMRGYIDGMRAASQLVTGAANYQDACERVDRAIEMLEGRLLNPAELDILEKHAIHGADANGDVSIDAEVLLELVRVAKGGA